jgi:photosystem I subunit 10
MVASTGLTLAAGRFGLAPTVAKGTTAGLKLIPRSNASGIMSNDPSGERWGGARRAPAMRCRGVPDAASPIARPRSHPPPPRLPLLPTGFTIVDTLALGALGHVLGVGIVLGLRATGGL